MQLVYTVKPLPESFFYFLWNYDVLDEKDECSYIERIILSKNKENPKWEAEYIKKIITKCVA